MTSKKTKTFFITLLTLIMVVSLFLGSVSALAAKPDAHQRCSDCSSNCKCIECFENCPTCKKDCPCKLNSDNHVDDKNSDKKEKEPIVDTPVKPESKKCADCHGSCDCTKSGNVCLGKDCPSCDRYKCPCGHSEEEQGGDDLNPNESHIHGNGKGCDLCEECGGCLCDH
ncbi:MAG: hypothetical protein IJC67_02000, partial [Clostridia bacterium]|nr:hypothetical protein [Clostridia bacterium]